MAARKKKAKKTTAKKRVAPKATRKKKPARSRAAARGETDIRRTAIHWALQRMR